MALSGSQLTRIGGQLSGVGIKQTFTAKAEAVITFVNEGTVFVLAALEAAVVRHSSLGAPVLAAVTNATIQDEQSVFIVREDKNR